MTNESPGLEPEPHPVSIELPRIVPIPDIPVALRGCWDAILPEDPEEPGGPHRLIITANSVTISGEGSGTEVATTEYVNRITPTAIHGMFSAPDQFGRSTVATSLMLGDGEDYGSPDQLRRSEGDAGSSYYSRCR